MTIEIYVLSSNGHDTNDYSGNKQIAQSKLFPSTLFNFHCDQRQMTTALRTAAGSEAIKENKMIDHFRK